VLQCFGQLGGSEGPVAPDVNSSQKNNECHFLVISPESRIAVGVTSRAAARRKVYPDLTFAELIARHVRRALASGPATIVADDG
jgi:hypothetical protein